MKTKPKERPVFAVESKAGKKIYLTESLKKKLGIGESKSLVKFKWLTTHD